MKQTTRQATEPKPLRYAPGQTVPFVENQHYEALLIEAGRDKDFHWKHSQVERAALAAYLRAKDKAERAAVR